MLIMRCLSVLLACSACTVVIAQATRQETTLTPQRFVVDNVIDATAEPAIRVRVDRAFRYAGGQRFILREVADAEQQFFVDAPDGRTIERLYWIQYESYLPDRRGEYDYSTNAAKHAWGLPLRVHVRRFIDPPVAGSDRAKAHEFLERKGLFLPAVSLRARLVHVPADNRRQELMIIYIERAGAAEPTSAEQDGLIERAIAGLTLMR